MPTYAYKCTSCDNSYETRESFDSPAHQPCPACGETAKRVIFPPPIVFKGSGFFVTDSRKGESATVTSDDAASSSESTGSENASGSSDDSNGGSTPTTTATPATTGKDDA